MRAARAPRALVAVVVAGFMGATSGAPIADAAKTTGRDGVTSITWKKPFKKSLKRSKVTVSSRRPTSATASRITLPAGTGGWDFSTHRGTIVQQGTTVLRRGKRSVTLGTPTTLVKSKGYVSFTIKGKSVRVFELLTNGSRFRDNAKISRVKGAKVRLTHAGAKALNTGLGKRAFRARQIDGLVSIAVANPKAPTASTTTPSAPSPGQGTLTIVREIIGTNGNVDLPIAGGSVNVDDPTRPIGTVSLDGSIRLETPVGSVVLTDPLIKLGTDDAGLYVTVDGAQVKLADFDLSQLRVRGDENLVTLDGLHLRVSPEGSGVLNGKLGTLALISGTPLGELRLAIPV